MTFPCLTCRAELDDSYKSCPKCGNEVSDFVREYSVKPVNGTYELLGRIRGGGMGEVFRARHLIFGTNFIIKVMKPALRDNAGLQKRFIREALLSRKVRHKHVATIADAGRLPDGALFIVAEFIEGTSFAHVIHAAAGLEPMRCLRIARQVLSGLEAIHAVNLIHRDISPDNIMISPGERGAERATIIDFGIAKEVGGDCSMTESNVFLGKLRYASPEQLKADPNAPVDGRADLYSFGIMLYEMLTGNVPFSASSAGELIALQFYANPPPLPADIATPALQAVVKRALAKSREDRFQSAAEFRIALEKAITPAAVPVRTRIAPPPSEKEDATRVLMKSSNANRKRAASFVAVAAVAILMIVGIIKLPSIFPPKPVQPEIVVPASTANIVAAPGADTAATPTAIARTVVPPEPEQVTAGALQGRVGISANDLLPGVTVKATVAGKSAHYETVTDAEGWYRIEHMAPGTYDLDFSLEDLVSRAKYLNVEIRSAVLLNVDAQLGLDVTEVITIVHPVMRQVAGQVPTSIVEPHE